MPVVKIKQFQRADIERGEVTKPLPISRLTVTDFVSDTDSSHRDAIEWKLKYSMIRNWLWKRSAYSNMIHGTGDNGLTDVQARIRKSVAEVVADTMNMLGAQDSQTAGAALQRNLQDMRLQHLKALIAVVQDALRQPGLALTFKQRNAVLAHQKNKKRGSSSSESDSESDDESPASSRSKSKPKAKHPETEAFQTQDFLELDIDEKGVLDSSVAKRILGHIDRITGEWDTEEKALDPGSDSDLTALTDFRLPQSLAPLEATSGHGLASAVKTWLSTEEAHPTVTYVTYIDYAVSKVKRHIQKYLQSLSTKDKIEVRKIRSLFQANETLQHFQEFLEAERKRQAQPLPAPKAHRTLSTQEFEVAKDVFKDYPEYGILKKKLQSSVRMYETIVGLVGELVESDLEPFDRQPHTEMLLLTTIPSKWKDAQKKKDWKEALVTADLRWKKLLQTFRAALRELRGRDTELNAVLHSIVAFAKNFRLPQDSYLNFALLGPAGTGKTTLAKFIGALYAASGILITGTFREATRTDLIGQHLGETAPRTAAMLEATREGVLFLDEVYALTQCMDGAEEAPARRTNHGCPKCAKWDPYGIEAVNTLVPFLSNNRGLIVVVVAGYTEDTWCTFFQANEGIPRRFPNVFILKALSTKDLLNIFRAKLARVTDGRITNLTTRARKLLFQIIADERDEYFNNGGGDIENLVQNVAAVVANAAQEPAVLNTCLLKTALEHYLWDKKGAKMECEANCECVHGEESPKVLPIDKLPDPDVQSEEDFQRQRAITLRTLLQATKTKIAQYEEAQQKWQSARTELKEQPHKSASDFQTLERLSDNLDLVKQALDQAHQLKKKLLSSQRRTPEDDRLLDTLVAQQLGLEALPSAEENLDARSENGEPAAKSSPRKRRRPR